MESLPEDFGTAFRSLRQAHTRSEEMRRFVIEQMPTPTRRQAALLKLCGRVADRFAAGAWRIGETLLLWQERYRQRRAVATLSDHMLKDLGFSRADVARESGKRFWEM
jgi:uncharacterized protein YjiS (DUF1127 family)